MILLKIFVLNSNSVVFVKSAHPKSGNIHKLVSKLFLIRSTMKLFDKTTVLRWIAQLMETWACFFLVIDMITGRTVGSYHDILLPLTIVIFSSLLTFCFNLSNKPGCCKYVWPSIWSTIRCIFTQQTLNRTYSKTFSQRTYVCKRGSSLAFAKLLALVLRNFHLSTSAQCFHSFFEYQLFVHPRAICPDTRWLGNFPLKWENPLSRSFLICQPNSQTNWRLSEYTGGNFWPAGWIGGEDRGLA